MSNHREHGGRHSRKKRLLVIAAVILAAMLVVGTSIWAIDRFWDSRETPHDGGGVPVAEKDVSVLEYNGKKYEKKSGLETFLVIGLDKFEDETEPDSYTNNQQADFLMLFVIDNESQTYTALNINRDTMAYMSVLGLAGEEIDTVYQQLTLSHTYGKGGKVSCRNTVDATEGVLRDIKIEHYTSVTMDAVSLLNDAVGGVEVYIEDDFSSVDETLVQGETVTLNGEQALTYVRSRRGMEDSSNNARMERQITYVKALVDKVEACLANDDGFVIELIDIIDEYLVSDCTITRLESFFEKMTTYEFVETYVLEGESVKGDRYMEFYPSEKSVDDTIIKLFYKPQEQ